jgi:hypothetical protein
MAPINLRGRHEEPVVEEQLSQETLQQLKEYAEANAIHDPYIIIPVASGAMDGTEIISTWDSDNLTTLTYNDISPSFQVNGSVNLNGVDFNRLMDFLKAKHPDLESYLNSSD